MKIAFFNRLYVRLWLAVVAAVLILSLLMGWFISGLMRQQAERIRAERLAEMPSREVILRNAAGEVVSQSTVRPVRVPGRGVELQVTLPQGVQGGEQLSITLPPRPPRGERADRVDRGAVSSEDFWSSPRWFNPNRPEGAQLGFIALLLVFGLAVALGSYPIVRRLTKRLESLQSGVERLGAGDLRARVLADGADEAAFLAKRFNSAADRIEALVQSQKSLLANASHELRSPLARIRMGLELMSEAPSEKLRAELSRNINELDALIDEILLASRLDSAPSTLSAKESVDLIGLCAEEGARSGIELQVMGHPAQTGAALNAEIEGDAKLLRRLIRNLLENAQRHGGKNIEFKLICAADKAQTAIKIEVSDDGLGIPESERQRIFEPFYRSRQASESSGGVGLGLALVKTIAEQHGGHVQCTSPEHGGTCFVVSLSATPMAKP